MRIVVIGLSLSSSWGNGHATTLRALLAALGQRHDILFLERDQPWYAANRDLPSPDFCRLVLYRDLADLSRWSEEIASADVVVLGSYVAEGAAVARLIAGWGKGILCFYDIDTPVTLRKLAEGDYQYLSPDVVPLFDIYFSFTGGPTLRRLESELGARRAVALYCSVGEARYHPSETAFRWDLGYLGTYSPDRQPTLDKLLLEPARQSPERRFVVAGSQYPANIRWPANVERIEHLPPAEHPSFYCAQRWTLNVTRQDMILAGYSPSVRLFEATACGVPVITDLWPGLETIFAIGTDILPADDADTVLSAIAMPDPARLAIAQAGRVRCLEAHTAAHRAAEFEAAVASTLRSKAITSTSRPMEVPA
jgi:spore maturation protein CgeB